jgi:hypothetical protein
MLPLASLNQIFETIASKGYYTLGNGQYVGPFMNEHCCICFENNFRRML